MGNYEIIYLNIAMLCAIFSVILMIRHKKILDSTIFASLFSVFAVLNYLLLDAPDVALTEAAVGSCLTAILIFIAVRFSHHHTKSESTSAISYTGLLVTIPLGILLCYGITTDFPGFGSTETFAHNNAAAYYIENTWHEIGIPNIVSAVLASYRGFDTLGETLVVLIAGIGMLVLLGEKNILDNVKYNIPKSIIPYMPIVHIMVNMVMPLILIFASYMLIHGEESPGGGFQAGAIFASGMVIYILNYGTERAYKIVSLSGYIKMAVSGMMLYVFTGVLSILCGGQYLEYAVFIPGNRELSEKLGIISIETGVTLTVFAVFTLAVLLLARVYDNNK